LQKHTESKSLRVLLDAQLPVRLIEILSELGFNEKLIHIFQKHHQTIKDLFELHFFVELTNEDLIVHQ
jgi:hypothetical protein